jgi:hypothetical protein
MKKIIIFIINFKILYLKCYNIYLFLIKKTFKNYFRIYNFIRLKKNNRLFVNKRICLINHGLVYGGCQN